MDTLSGGNMKEVISTATDAGAPNIMRNSLNDLMEHSDGEQEGIENG